MSIVRCCVALAVLAVPLTARACTLQTGLYRVTEGENGQLVQRHDTAAGGEVRLNGLLSEKLNEASLVSIANDNSLFNLSLKAGPIPEGEDHGPSAVVVGGLCLVAWGHSDRHEDGSMDIATRVAGLEAAQKVAEAMGIEPKLRKHPGHALLVTVEPKQPSYRPGEAVTLVMTIKNVGETTFSFYNGGQQRGARNNQFSFTAFTSSRALPDTGDPRHHGGLMGLKRLAPGGVFTKEVLLTNWFEFSEPGSYRITAIYELDLLDEDRRTIWDDFAVARCWLRISAPEPAKGSEATSPVEEPSTRQGAGT